MELTAVLFYDELVAKCKQGDVQSYEMLYRRYAKTMFNTSLRIVNNTPDAEDVLQESFAAAFHYLDKFDYSSTFGAWLKRIVINKSINVLRKRKVALMDIDDTKADEIQDGEMPDEENIQLKVEEIRKAVSLLPNGYRTVLSLFLFEGYDYEEIGDILQISGSTVRTQYHRAKQKLLNIIKQGVK
ncbi:MAG: sigma-70 family RNA polymerase sigma factor [Bacteroidota bacterium]|nr:sigma-70 family RNA polymerase sigma factor [Bacteroidota bacterium]